MTIDWKDIRPVLLGMRDLPAWVVEVIDGDSTLLPEGVSLEDEYVDASYIEFLREQIDLAPRGPQWNQVLKTRMSALEPEVGQTLTRVAIRHGDAEFILR